MGLALHAQQGCTLTCELCPFNAMHRSSRTSASVQRGLRCGPATLRVLRCRHQPQRPWLPQQLPVHLLLSPWLGPRWPLFKCLYTQQQARRA